MKNRLFYFLLILVFLLFVLSCKKDIGKADIEKLVTEWTGKAIQFPQNIPCISQGKDTICPDMNTPYKILLYSDSAGCISCKMHLQKWNVLIKEAEDNMPGKVSFLFYFQPKDERELQILFKRDNFNYPVRIDRENKINTTNKFPSETSFQCFLLDSSDRVVLIGNPTFNPRIWELYKEIITEEKEVSNGVQTTTVEIEQTEEVELKNLKVGEIATAIFVLKNTGEKPLLIKDVSASCGCTVPEWDKKPVKPGDKTEIKIKVTPDNTGYFRKTITVFCNIKGSPIQLGLKGMCES